LNFVHIFVEDVLFENIAYSVRLMGLISFYFITALNASNLVLEIVKHYKIWGGTICISVPLTPNSGGLVPPFPMICAHEWASAPRKGI